MSCVERGAASDCFGAYSARAQTPRPVHGRRAGFTVIEAAAALSILSIVVVGWLVAVGQELTSLARAAEMMSAAALAEDRLAAVRLFASGVDLRLPDSIRAGRFPAPIDAFSWEAESRPSTVHPLLMDVRVTVRWSGGEESLVARVRAAGYSAAVDR
jgi:hypothetical protein